MEHYTSAIVRSRARQGAQISKAAARRLVLLVVELVLLLRLARVFVDAPKRAAARWA